MTAPPASALQRAAVQAFSGSPPFDLASVAPSVFARQQIPAGHGPDDAVKAARTLDAPSAVAFVAMLTRTDAVRAVFAAESRKTVQRACALTGRLDEQAVLSLFPLRRDDDELVSAARATLGPARFLAAACEGRFGRGATSETVSAALALGTADAYRSVLEHVTLPDRDAIRLFDEADAATLTSVPAEVLLDTFERSRWDFGAERQLRDLLVEVMRSCSDPALWQRMLAATSYTSELIEPLALQAASAPALRPLLVETVANTDRYYKGRRIAEVAGLLPDVDVDLVGLLDLAAMTFPADDDTLHLLLSKATPAAIEELAESTTGRKAAAALLSGALDAGGRQQVLARLTLDELTRVVAFVTEAELAEFVRATPDPARATEQIVEQCGMEPAPTGRRRWRSTTHRFPPGSDEAGRVIRSLVAADQSLTLVASLDTAHWTTQLAEGACAADDTFAVHLAVAGAPVPQQFAPALFTTDDAEVVAAGLRQAADGTLDLELAADLLRDLQSQDPTLVASAADRWLRACDDEVAPDGECALLDVIGPGLLLGERPPAALLRWTARYAQRQPVFGLSAWATLFTLSEGWTGTVEELVDTAVSLSR